MKIFNWVHRRFNHKDGLAQNAKTSGVTTSDEKQFLLENNEFSSSTMFDGWKGGILAIGTLGYDPLKDDHDFISTYEDELAKKEKLISAVVLQESELSDCHDNCQITDDSEEEGEEDDDVNPLMYAAYAHDYEGLLQKMKGNEGGAVYSAAAGTEGEEEFGYDVEAMMKMNSSSSKRERITLAELFSADSDDDDQEMMQKKHPQAEAGEMMMKQKSRSNDKAYDYKNGTRLSFAKKIIGEDARPAIHKLNRLMRRMLNRKIHPDVVVAHHHNNPTSNFKVVPKKRHSQLPLPC